MNTRLDDMATIGAALFGVDTDTFRDWRWQMANQVTSAADAARLLNIATTDAHGWSATWNNTPQPWPAGLSPYTIALLRANNMAPELTRQVIPDNQECATSTGEIDPLTEQANSPVPEVIHLYPDRVAFCVAERCSTYCRFCFRKRRGQRPEMHFNEQIIERGIAYIAGCPAIKDVLITGGDPFLGSDDAIDRLLTRLRSIPHVEIIRFGTRTPVTLPYRVTEELATTLARHHPVFVNTHFNTVLEVNPDAAKAVTCLVNAGIPVGNQAVLLRGVNDSSQAQIELGRALLRMRARPYYLFHPHRVEGTDHLRVPLHKGIQVIRGMRGNITGLGIPTYIVDTPSGKIPIGHSHVLGTDGHDVLLEEVRGGIWREKDAEFDETTENL